jgi:hypothetical protein
MIPRIVLWAIACYGFLKFIYFGSPVEKIVNSIINFPFYNVAIITVKSCYYFIESFMIYLGNKIQQQLIIKLEEHIMSDPNIVDELLKNDMNSGDENPENIEEDNSDNMEEVPNDTTDFDMDEVDDMTITPEKVDKGKQKETAPSQPSREELTKKLRDKRKGMQSQRKPGTSSVDKLSQMTGKSLPRNIPPQYQSLLNGLTKDMDMDDMMSKIPAELKDSNGNLKTDRATLMKALSQMKKKS